MSNSVSCTSFISKIRSDDLSHSALKFDEESVENKVTSLYRIFCIHQCTRRDIRVKQKCTTARERFYTCKALHLLYYCSKWIYKDQKKKQKGFLFQFANFLFSNLLLPTLIIILCTSTEKKGERSWKLY